MFFFFSSRRRHTRYWRDWSSDCALPISRSRSDGRVNVTVASTTGSDATPGAVGVVEIEQSPPSGHPRSEERRVGKGVDLGGRRLCKKKTVNRRRRQNKASTVTLSAPRET